MNRMTLGAMTPELGGADPLEGLPKAAPMKLNTLAGTLPISQPAVKLAVQEQVQPLRRIEETPPIIDRLPPIVDRVPPIIDRFPPVVDPVPPVIIKQPPIIDRFPPVLDPPPQPPAEPPRPPVVTPPPVSQTATQLARSALVTLTNATPEVVTEALNFIRTQNLKAVDLLDYLERRVRVGEVLNQLASTWSETTVGDFAEALRMGREKRATMDAIVAVAILNERDLEGELLAENLPQTSAADLADNRVIVSQWPPGGTVMQPPYVFLVAVEYRNVSQAQEVVNAIMSQLVDHDGVKLPRAAAERLRPTR